MTVAAFHPVRPAALFGFVAPFLAFATLAFLAGFGGYLILGPANVLDLSAHRAGAHTETATPAHVVLSPAADAFNPRRPV